MINLTARTAVPVLIGIAFGIFFTLSCSTVEQTESSTEELTTTDRLEMQLNEINQRIQQEPENSRHYQEKSEVLYSIAKNQPVQQRQPVYQNLRDHSNSAENQLGKYQPELDEILKKAWSDEQSKGVQILQQHRDDGTNEHYPEILAHFNNAITIIPDSLVTYSLKATTLYENGYLNEATETLETAINISDSSKPELLEKLAYLYLESGKIENSIAIYEDLAIDKPNDQHIKHGLINAYIIQENHEDAAVILNELSESYPSRYIYQEALANQKYFIFENKAGELLRSDYNGSQEDSINEIGALADDIHTIYDSLRTKMPVNEENTLRMAAFYKQAHSIFSEILQWGDFEDEEASEIVERKEQFADFALPLWERLVELNPDNLEYLHNLYEVYTLLGMDDDAEAIERSINF